MKSKTNPKTQSLLLRNRILLRLRRIHRRRLVRRRIEAPAVPMDPPSPAHSPAPAVPATPLLSEEDALFLSIYNQEMESSTLVRRGLHIPEEEFSYRSERIGGQNILPNVLNQGGTHFCHFMATTACVEARYRLYLARTQNDFQYGGSEGGRQPSSLFEQLAWQSWIPKGFLAPPGSEMIGPGGPNEGQDWLHFTRPIMTTGIPIQREYSNGFEKPCTHYRTDDLKNYTLSCYNEGGISMEQTSFDWATLTTELKMRGPFVANFRPNKDWFTNNGITAYSGDQGPPNAMGHAVLVTGYDRSNRGRFFEIMNSYGVEWGKKGFGWVQQECLDWILMPSTVKPR